MSYENFSLFWDSNNYCAWLSSYSFRSKSSIYSSCAYWYSLRSFVKAASISAAFFDIAYECSLHCCSFYSATLSLTKFSLAVACNLISMLLTWLRNSCIVSSPTNICFCRSSFARSSSEIFCFCSVSWFLSKSPCDYSTIRSFCNYVISRLSSSFKCLSFFELDSRSWLKLI